MKRHLKALVARSFSHRRRVPDRGGDGSARRVLVLRDGGLGDMILTAPVLRSLRAALGPEAQVDLMCRWPSAGVIEGTGLADRVMAVRGNPFVSVVRAFRLRREKYDTVIDLVMSASLSWGLRMVAAAPGACRTGGDKGEMSPMYDVLAELPPRPSMHFLTRLHRVACSAIRDFPLLDATPWLVYPAEVRREAERVWAKALGKAESGDSRIVWVNLSAGHARRRWPLARYAELIGRLIQGDGNASVRVVVSSAPGEYKAAQGMIDEIDGAHVTLLPLVRDFRVVVEMLGRADLLVTPDTSMVHAASAQGVPAVVLSVAENAVTWAPWKVPHIMVSAPPGEGAASIDVAEVAAAIRRIGDV